MVCRRWRGGTAHFLAALLLAGALSACSHGPQRGLPIGTFTFRTASAPVSIRVEIADTAKSRRIGLMYRTALAGDSGMVFLWPSPIHSGFWMKNTLIPLSIAFWDQQRRIIDIREMRPCKSAYCPLYYPQTPYVGAVEANQGFLTEHGIAVGDHVTLAR